MKSFNRKSCEDQRIKKREGHTKPKEIARMQIDLVLCEVCDTFAFEVI